MSIIRVTDKLSKTFYVDDEACPWVAGYLVTGELRTLPVDRAPAPEQVIDGTIARLALGGQEVDFSKTCNWGVAAQVSAHQSNLLRGDETP